MSEAELAAFQNIVFVLETIVNAGSLCTFISYQEMVTLQEEKKKYFVEEQQLHALQERIGEVEQFYAGIRRIKHEMRNHLANIKGLAESGKYEDMEQYIAKMDGKERYIVLSGRQKRKFFLIEVQNSFEGEIEFDKNTDLPVSTKQYNNSLHGIGLFNVKQEVEKYMGNLKR